MKVKVRRSMGASHPATVPTAMCKSRTPLVARLVLAGLLVVSLMPLVNLAGGFPTVARAEDAGAGAPQADAGAGAPQADAGAGAPQAEGAGAGVATTAGAAASATGGAAATIAEKEEVVYGLLDGTGAPHSGYVVNRFEVDGAGTLTDRGNYRSVANLSTTAELTLSGGKVSGAVEKGDFYYEGVLETVVLPWLIDISYTLDGRSVTPQELAGASGPLKIHIKTRQNAKVDSTFFENYLLQIQLTLDADRVRGIVAPDATVATAGKNKQLAFMVLPGKEGDLTFSAQVTDFEMPGIQISALPFSMAFDIPDTAGMVEDMTKLSDAIGELNEGVGKLQDGVADMKGGAADLASGSASINEGLSLLSGNSAHLTSASSQIDDALAQIAAQLEGGAIDPSQIEQLVGGLRQLSAGLSSGDPLQPGLAEGLGQVQGGINTATAAMDAQIGALAPVGADAIGNLSTDTAFSTLSDASKTTIGSLITTNTQALYVRGTWYGPNGTDGVKAGLNAAATGLDQSISGCQYMAGQLDAIATGLESGLSGIAGLQTLTAAMKQLSSNYSAFDEGLATYAGGVDTLATNYRTFNSGLAQFAGGVGDLYGGISDLHDGTRELYLNVEDLPETMQEEIDSFLKDYQKSDFTPVSFLSADNKHVTRTQFVLLTDAIKLPPPEDDPPADAPAETSLWDRLTALFTS